jgi:hypothetical protein
MVLAMAWPDQVKGEEERVFQDVEMENIQHNDIHTGNGINFQKKAFY